jgi:HPt (histidine-containing phosphotransfer) domain-containing protein
MMTAPTIDRATYDALREAAGAGFVVELVDTFAEEAPGMLAELRRAQATNDAETFRRAAHSLKSNGSTFGATAFAAMARELELGGLASVASRGDEPLVALEGEYARVVAALKALRHA